jgi:hypothetical protein
VACGLLLAATSSTVVAANGTPSRQRHLERAACKLISVPPEPASGSFEAISEPISTLVALKKTNNKLLQEAVRSYNLAAKAQNTRGMIRALADGAKVCHDLGLPTTPWDTSVG